MHIGKPNLRLRCLLLTESSRDQLKKPCLKSFSIDTQARCCLSSSFSSQLEGNLCWYGGHTCIVSQVSSKAKRGELLWPSKALQRQCSWSCTQSLSIFWHLVSECLLHLSRNETCKICSQTTCTQPAVQGIQLRGSVCAMLRKSTAPKWNARPAKSSLKSLLALETLARCTCSCFLIAPWLNSEEGNVYCKSHFLPRVSSSKWIGLVWWRSRKA